MLPNHREINASLERNMALKRKFADHENLVFSGKTWREFFNDDWFKFSNNGDELRFDQHHPVPPHSDIHIGLQIREEIKNTLRYFKNHSDEKTTNEIKKAIKI